MDSHTPGADTRSPQLPPRSEPLGEAVAAALGLTPAGAAIVTQIRAGDPLRRPQPGTQSWAGAEYLDLMGFTVGVESRTLERAFYRLVPRQPDLWEIYDQAYTLTLRVIRANGKQAPPSPHVPDALCIRPTRVHFTECKPWDTLVSISEKRPDRFVLDTSGVWRSPAAERSLAGTGIGYEVYTERNINPTLLRNVNFLRDYERDGSPPIELIRTAVNALAREPILRIEQLLGVVPDRRAIYCGITRGDFYFDLSSDLASNDLSPVFRDHAIFRCEQLLLQYAPTKTCPIQKFEFPRGTQVVLNGEDGEVVSSDENAIWVRLQSGNVQQLAIATLVPLLLTKRLQPFASKETLGALARQQLAKATPSELERAIATFNHLQPWLTATATEATSRTIRRQRRCFREAATIFGHGLVGLLDKTRQRGNRNSKLTPSQETIIKDKIDAEYLDNARSIDGTLALINAALKQDGERRINRRALVRRINKMPKEERERRRHGSRMGNASRAPHSVTAQPVKGERAFEAGLIDSFAVPMKVRSRRTDQPIDTPLWATLLWNGYPPHPLGLALQFAKPSTRSVMAACRDCVRRHNRLPDNIYHDLGSEHGGLTFDLMKAEYHISYLNRAAGNPRFGADIEAHIGSLKNMIREYSGSFKRLPRRGATASHSPAAKTKWYWDEFDADFRRLVFDDWPNMEHDGIATVPGPFFEKSLRDQGERPVRYIPYDDAFLVLTMPIVKAAAKVHPTRGIRYDYVWYHSRPLNDPKWHDVDVTIREPVDESHIIVQLGGDWVRCDPVSYVFQLFTHRDQRLLLEEWRAESAASNSRERLTPEAFERFMCRVAEHERRFDESAEHEPADANPTSPDTGSAPAPSAPSDQQSPNDTEDAFVFDPAPLL